MDKDFLDNVWKKEKVQMQSDLIRLNLLNTHGGIWVDATAYCSIPLRQWLPYHLTTGVFYFRSHSKYPISNWFIVSNKNTYVTKTFTKQHNKYWENRVSDNNYFNMHHNFKQLMKEDIYFKDQVLNIPYKSSISSRLWKLYKTPNRKTDTDRLNNKNIPVLKLTNRQTIPDKYGSDMFIHDLIIKNNTM